MKKILLLLAFAFSALGLSQAQKFEEPLIVNQEREFDVEEYEKSEEYKETMKLIQDVQNNPEWEEQSQKLGNVPPRIFTGILNLIILFWILGIIPVYKIYQKAKKPGWHSIIPFLNITTLGKITKKAAVAMNAIKIIPIVMKTAENSLGMNSAKPLRLS